MLTIFSIPKAFSGADRIIQENAIRSWKHLHPKIEIILVGDEEGVSAVCQKHALLHIPQAERNAYGTPLLSSAFVLASQASSYPLLCFLNADIILMKSFVTALQRIPFKTYVAIGQRWDFDISPSFHYHPETQEKALEKLVKSCAFLHAPYGSDFFVFPKVPGLIQIPPFAVGRPYWDNWFVYQACFLGLPVIDLTRVTTVVHQSLDSRRNSSVTAERAQSSEGKENLRLAGIQAAQYTIMDAGYFMTPSGIKRAHLWNQLRKSWHKILKSSPFQPFFLQSLNFLGSPFRTLRRRQRRKKLHYQKQQALFSFLL